MQRDFNKESEIYLIPEQRFADSQNPQILFNPILPEIVLDYQQKQPIDNYKENISSENIQDDNCNQLNHLQLFNDIPTQNSINILQTKSSQNLKFGTYENSNLTFPSSNYFQNTKSFQKLDERQPLGIIQMNQSQLFQNPAELLNYNLNISQKTGQENNGDAQNKNEIFKQEAQSLNILKCKSALSIGNERNNNLQVLYMQKLSNQQAKLYNRKKSSITKLNHSKLLGRLSKPIFKVTNSQRDKNSRKTSSQKDRRLKLSESKKNKQLSQQDANTGAITFAYQVHDKVDLQSQACSINEQKINIASQLQNQSNFLTPQLKIEKLNDFKVFNKYMVETGQIMYQTLQDIQTCLLQIELRDSCEIKNERIQTEEGYISALQNPLKGHNISAEFRTKMTDWMVEVCTSFLCQPRTYFLAVTVLDKALVAAQQNGVVLENQDIHLIGVASIYLASKYEDIQPLHSKTVAEKIAHDVLSQQQIIQKERELLLYFNFEMDFVTHYDFFQVYSQKILENLKMKIKICQKFELDSLLQQNEDNLDQERFDLLVEKLNTMTLLLIKMAMQQVDFSEYSYSTITLSAFYAATAFLKHSKLLQGINIQSFICKVRSIIFQIIDDQYKLIQIDLIPKITQKDNSIKFNPSKIEIYNNQNCKMFIEQISMDLVDFFKVFDEWHCGLNQLKKFTNDEFIQLNNFFC